jgi:hypothetical protein
MRRLGITAVLPLLAVLPACGTSATALSQPVSFSHRIHAGVNRIGCPMCHAYAEHSRVAGIPSMARCVGCHKFVAKDKPDVQLVVTTYREGKVLEWKRVHRLPDHVFFTHERHLARGLRCQECHGDVAAMDVLVQVSPLTMGWCVDCHRTRQAPTDCLTCHK